MYLKIIFSGKYLHKSKSSIWQYTITIPTIIDTAPTKVKNPSPSITHLASKNTIAIPKIMSAIPMTIHSMDCPLS